MTVRELDRATTRAAMRDGVAVPIELIDLLLQAGLRTDTGTALIVGYRLGNPAIGLHLGPATLTLRGDGVLRLTSVPVGHDEAI